MAEEVTTAQVDTEATAAEQGQQAQQFTQEQMEYIDKMIQSASDKRVTQALQTQAKKYEQQLSLSKLDGAEREKAEQANRIAELEGQLREFQVERNRSEVKSVLSSRGLSAEFADILGIGEDVEANQQKIEKLDKLIKAAVASEVKARLSSNVPKAGEASGQPLTKESFAKMPLSEQMKIYTQNRELYDKLTM